MIVRDDGDGLIIIRQGDHAALAADIAKAWHPPGQPRQRPINSLLVAAEHHDAGWRAWEDSTPNALDEDGRPRDFLHMPLDDHLAIWRASIDQTTQHDLYAGILVSMHAVALYELRLETLPDPEAARAQIRAFIDEQLVWQAKMTPLLAERPYYAARLSETGMSADLNLLQAWDFLSLMLCVPWTTSRAFEEIRFPDGQLSTLTVIAGDEGTLALNPYPLHQEPYSLSVTGRRLPQKNFTRPADLAHAYAAARTVELRFTLRSALSGS
jgi:hypothetical protein